MTETIAMVVLAIAAVALFINLRKPGTKRRIRRNQKHKRLVKRKWFRVYYSGAYAWLEVDFGRIGHHEFVLLFGCIDRVVNWCHNKPHA